MKISNRNANLRDFTAQNSLVVLCTLVSVVLQGYKTQGGTFDGQRSKSLRNLEHQVLNNFDPSQTDSKHQLLLALGIMVKLYVA